jgi:hypothetical protein
MQNVRLLETSGVCINPGGWAIKPEGHNCIVTLDMLNVVIALSKGFAQDEFSAL